MRIERGPTAALMGRHTQPINALTDASRLSPATLAMVIIVHLGIFSTLGSLHVATDQPALSAMMIEVIQADAPKPINLESRSKKPETAPRKMKTLSPQDRPKPPADTTLLATKAAHFSSASEVKEPDKQAAQSAMQSHFSPATPQSPAAVAQSLPRFDADYLDNPAPGYPTTSRRSGEEGKVVLRVYVEPSGLPGKVEVRTSTGFERLDKSAIAAVSRWRFVPAKQGAESVGAWVLIPIVFNLKV